jgi:transcription elongation factor Elf1
MKCNQCDSTNITYNSIEGNHICDDCGNEIQMDVIKLFNDVTTLGWTDGFIDGCKYQLVQLEKIKQTALNLLVKYTNDNFMRLSVQQADFRIKNLNKAIEILNLIKNTYNDDEIMLYCEELKEII